MRAAAAMLALAAVLVSAACSGDDGDAAAGIPPPTSAADPERSLHDLEVGDCFDGLDDGQDLEVRLVDCGRRHQAEVYGAIDLTVRRFPGADGLRREAATGCAQRFAGYTGEPSGPGTDVAFVEVVPTLESWTAGDRRALCVALGLDDAPRQGSIAASGPS